MRPRVPAVALLIVASLALAPADAAAETFRKSTSTRVAVPPKAPILPASDLVVGFPGHLVTPCIFEGKYSQLKLSFSIENVGPGPAMASQGIAVRAWTDKPLAVDKVKYSSTIEPVVYGPKLLNPGQSFAMSLVMTIGPAQDNGPYKVMIGVDTQNQIRETNENNNTSFMKIPWDPAMCTGVQK